MTFGEIASLISIVEKLRSWYLRRSGRREGSIADRFISVFEAHGVHRNQIPRAFGHGLTLSIVGSESRLSESLTSEMLNDVAELFAVNLAWLEGASEQIYPLHDFYKKPEQAESFLDAIRSRTDGASGVVLAAESSKHEESALVILEEEIGKIDDDKPLCRYHFCNNWFFPYWKSRAFLAAFVAAAWRRRIYLLGRMVPIETIRQYRAGRTLLRSDFGSALPLNGKIWHPEDMLVKAKCFLDGLDEGEYGRVQGLDLWLRLQEIGFLATDLPYVNVREEFEGRLFLERRSRRLAGASGARRPRIHDES